MERGRMHSSLTECLADYKVTHESKNVDFDADKAVQYEWLQKRNCEKIWRKLAFRAKFADGDTPGELS